MEFSEVSEKTEREDHISWRQWKATDCRTADATGVTRMLDT